jgi:hypothetical protein
MGVFLASGLFSGAKQEETEKKPRNPEWTLAVTAFDVSALPPSRRVVGDLLVKNLLNELNAISYRVRVSEEHTFYQDYAWAQDRGAAAKNLALKRSERDALAFQGYPAWKYRKELKAVDAKIRELEEALRTAEAERPAITAEPVFKLTDANRSGTFPPPPQPGTEYQFCMKEKADAFLTGKVIEFHERLYVTLEMYARYSQSYEYEDAVIFSLEDTQEGIKELTARVVSAVSGEEPATVIIHSEQEDAVILLDGSFAGYGEVGPLEHPPGKVAIESFAGDYQPADAVLELRAGELAELYINLQPLSREALTITVPDESAKVYRGALYLGQTPLEADVPAGKADYFHVETPEGNTGALIRRGGSGSSTVFIDTDKPITAAEGKVAKARRNFYGSWARFWIALPTAFLLQGVNDAQRSAYNATGNASLYQQAQNVQYVSIGAWVVFGLATAEAVFRTAVYLYAAGKSPDPLAGAKTKN